MLKLWAFIYRHTGWYSPFARVAEYEAVREWLRTPKAFTTAKKYGLAAASGVFIGSWQAEHGFVRPYHRKSR